jgi:4-hydroxy-tetrahydrodipicolinate reductase
MGRLVCETVSQTDGLGLAGSVDEGDSLDSLRGCDVVVDFTRPDVVMGHVAWAIEAGIDLVIGTSGFTAERLDEVRAALGESPRSAVLVVPNFSIGAVLMMRFAAMAAPWFDSAEIVEAHHPGKADAPSGTALQTARIIAEARSGRAPMADATVSALDGARGAEVEGVRVHALRLPGLIAAQEVTFASAGETLVIKDDARDRSSFMPGVVAAIRWIGGRSGLTVGLEPVLGLA